MDTLKRGTRIARSWRILLPLPELGVGAALRFAGVRVKPQDETKHFKLLGTTGTGKSTAIAGLLRQTLARADRVVIADPDGGYLARFLDHRRGDVVLNPFEPGSCKWDPFAEIDADYDFEQLASALIAPSADAAGQEWRGYARTFVAAVLRRCRDRADVGELWRLLAVASPRELRAVVAGTPAQPFLAAENARMFGSIRSVTGSCVAALEFIRAQQGARFGVRDWVRNGRGALFIPYRAAQIAALRSVIATWLRLAIFEVMNRTEEGGERIWFVVDELDALGAIDGLKDALARLRKFGGRCVLGFQSIAQVHGAYGPSDAQTIVENCANTLILRCSGSDQGGTSQFASQLIGEREIVRRQAARAPGGGWIDGSSRRAPGVGEQHVTEMAVMASELEQLPDLTGYLKTASSRVWRRVRLSR